VAKVHLKVVSFPGPARLYVAC